MSGAAWGQNVSHEVSQASTREPDLGLLPCTRKQKRHLRQDDARGGNKARDVKLVSDFQSLYCFFDRIPSDE